MGTPKLPLCPGRLTAEKKYVDGCPTYVCPKPSKVIPPLIVVDPPIACAEAMVICPPGVKPLSKKVNGCNTWYCPDQKPHVDPLPIKPPKKDCGPVAMPDCVGDYDLTKYEVDGCPQYKCCQKSVVPCNRMQVTK